MLMQQLKHQHILDQLQKYPITDKEKKPRHEMDYKEIRRLLAIYRALEVDVKSPHSSWF